MEIGIEPETRNLYESRASVFDRAMYSVDPEKPRNPKDQFERIRIMADGFITSEISLALNRILEHNGHIIVVDPSIKTQDNRFLRTLYIVERDKMTTVAIPSFGRKPRFVTQVYEEIPGDVGLFLSPSTEADDQIVIKIFKGEMIIKTLPSTPSFPLEVLVHKGDVFPVLARDEGTNKPWFLNRRVFTPSQTGLKMNAEKANT